MLKTDDKWAKAVDVIVIGYGLAGATAAITASDLGSEVLLLEKSRQAGIHSNSSMAGSWIMGVSDLPRAVQYLEALNRTNGNRPWTDPEIIREMAKYLADSPAWLQRLGGKVDFALNKSEHQLPGGESLALWRYAGMGFRMMDFLYGKVKDRGVQVAYGTAARRLLTNLRGEVIGVRVKPGEGKEGDIRARRAVIMACGGFEFNEPMKLNYLKAYPAYFTGTETNTGDGIRMAMEAGADLWHMNCVAARFVLKLPGMPWAVSMEFAGLNSERQMMAGGLENGEKQAESPGFIVVDRGGKRYTNEVYKGHSLYYELGLFDSQRLVYPRIPSYYVFDQRRMEAGRLTGNRGGATGAHQLYHWSSDNSDELAKGWIITAVTPRKLARKLDIPAETLERTIAAYNRFCQRGKDPECGRHPATLVPLDSPPFYACRLWPGGPNTQGGPRRNVRGQILNTDGDPIPGLYGAGELGSIFGMLYPVGGGNLSECIASGRVAGENAAEGLSP
ncbi:MAG: FAD-dependent oxidoreductase [Chloroflexi bacterium]|nr:FAD-dependent oxidoreductase [Chloroflexota bacterium]